MATPTELADTTSNGLLLDLHAELARWNGVPTAGRITTDPAPPRVSDQPILRVT